MRFPHDGLAWDEPGQRPPTVAELREWLADKPDDATVTAHERRIYVNNFGAKQKRSNLRLTEDIGTGGRL